MEDSNIMDAKEGRKDRIPSQRPQLFRELLLQLLPWLLPQLLPQQLCRRARSSPFNASKHLLHRLLLLPLLLLPSLLQLAQQQPPMSHWLSAAAAFLCNKGSSHPLLITPPHHHTLCKCQCFHPPLIYHTPFMGPATYTLSPGSHKVAHPPQGTTSGDTLF